VVSTSDIKSPKALKSSDISRSSTEEKTQVVYGEEKTIDLTVRFLNNAKGASAAVLILRHYVLG
jgi:hypothetical protein